MSLTAGLAIGRSQNRQNMKDGFRRLKRILATCGEEVIDDDELKTKDPLLLSIRNFERRIGDAEELISLPVDQVFSDQDKLHLRRAILGAEQELKSMEDQYYAAEAKYNTAALKNKKPEKVTELESEKDRIKQAYDQAQECLTDLKKTQVQRETDQRDMMEKEGRGIFGGRKKTPDPTADGETMSREPVSAIDGGAGTKKTMKKAMDMLARSQGIVDDEDSQNQQDGMDTSAYQWDPSVSLATETATRQQYTQITKQKREVQASLSRIHDGVARLHEMSKIMAAEIENQSRRVDNLDTIVEQRQQKLQDLNEKVEKLNDSMKPMNFCFNILCFLILLGVVGYLLNYYRVVSLF